MSFEGVKGERCLLLKPKKVKFNDHIFIRHCDSVVSLECLKQTNKFPFMVVADYQLAAVFRHRNTSALQSGLEQTEIVPCP